jgi:hypothetical protein
MVREWSRESFSRHPPHPYLPERFVSEVVEDNRFTETQDMHRRQPPMVTNPRFYMLKYSLTWNSSKSPKLSGKIVGYQPDITLWL